MATTDASKQCSIINNTGKDITVILAVPPDEVSNGTALSSAGGGVEMLKTTQSDTIIRNGASGIVTLDHNYQGGSDASGYIHDYNLVVSNSTWLYPLADLRVQQQGTNGSSGFKPQTVTANDLPAMKNAITLYQTLAAFPDSELSKNYIASLHAAKDAAHAQADGSPDSAQKVADAISKTMDAFFSASQDYQQVTLGDMVAISTYYNNLPCVWAQYKDSLNYYLYGSDGTTSVFAGTLSLEKTGNIDITKTNAGYTCLFTPAVNSTDLNSSSVDSARAVSLYYKNGLFLNDEKAANPAIALKGSFLGRRLFTNDAKDNGVAFVVTGTVNGILCIGLDTAQEVNSPDQQLLAATESVPDLVVKYWNHLTHPKTLKDWIISMATLVGAVTLIGTTAFMIYRIYKLVKFKAQLKETLSKKLIDENLEQQDREIRDDGIKWTGDNEKDIAEYYNLSAQQVAEIVEGASLSQAISGTFNLQRIFVKELLEYSSHMDPADVATLQDLLTSMQGSAMSASKAIDDTLFKNPELVAERRALLGQELENLEHYQETFDNLYNKVQDKISRESREDIEEVMGSAKRYAAALKEDFERIAEVETDARPKVEEEIEPFG